MDLAALSQAAVMFTSPHFTRFEPHPLLGQIFRGSAAIREGALSRAQLRRAPWLQVFRDVYLDGTELDNRKIPHDIRCHAAALLLPTCAAFTGKSALYLHGVKLADNHDPVEVLLPAKPARRVRIVGVRVTASRLAEDDVLISDNLRVATPLRAALDIAHRFSVEEAVVLLDALTHAKRLDLTQLVEALGHERPGQRGCLKAQQVVGLMDPRSESPQESRLRIRLTHSKVPPPQAQFEIADQQGFVARVDFAWPEQRLAVEYDGAWHTEPGQIDADSRREARLNRCGWTVLRVTVDRFHHHFDEIIADIRRYIA